MLQNYYKVVEKPNLLVFLVFRWCSLLAVCAGDAQSVMA
jgi:hypothetical protein